MPDWPILDQGRGPLFPLPSPYPPPFFLRSLKGPGTEDTHFPNTGPGRRLKSVGWVQTLPLSFSRWEIDPNRAFNVLICKRELMLCEHHSSWRDGGWTSSGAPWKQYRGAGQKGWDSGSHTALDSNCACCTGQL